MADLTDMLQEELKTEEIFKTFEINKESLNDELRQFTSIITSEIVDRDGEVIKIDGINLKTYRTNPKVLWGHDAQKFPIGKCISIRRSGNTLVTKTQLAFDDVDADRIWNLIKQDMIKTVSIGLRINREGVRSPNKKDIQDYGKSVKRVFSKSHMLEYSLVNLPGNPDSMITSVSKGLITREDCKKYLDYDVPQEIEKTVHYVDVISNNKTEEQVMNELTALKMAKKLGVFYI